jgi:hypothetical protein
MNAKLAKTTKNPTISSFAIIVVFGPFVIGRGGKVRWTVAKASNYAR